MSSVLRRGGLFSVVLAGALAAPVAARQTDPNEVAQRLLVEREHLRSVVSEALSASKEIARKDRAQAIDILKAAKAKIEADTEALKPVQRQDLLRKLSLAIQAYEGYAERVTPAVTPGPANTGTVRQQASDRNRTDEDRQRYENLKRDFYSKRNQVAEGKSIERLREGAFNAQQRDLAKSMVLPKGDFTYPADWAARMKRRSTGIKLTDLEKKIVKALNTPMPMEVEGKTFKEVLDYMREKSGVSIIVDPKALEDLNITYNTPINLKVGKVSMRTVLKKLLGDLSLTYVMKDEAIQITTPERAKALLTARVYSVADLVPAVDMRMPAVLAQVQAYQMLQQLVVLITQTIEPDSWEVNGKGGLGTITFDPVRFALVVKQSAEMHYLLGFSSLGGGK